VSAYSAVSFRHIRGTVWWRLASDREPAVFIPVSARLLFIRVCAWLTVVCVHQFYRAAAVSNRQRAAHDFYFFFFPFIFLLFFAFCPLVFTSWQRAMAILSQTLVPRMKPYLIVHNGRLRVIRQQSEVRSQGKTVEGVARSSVFSYVSDKI